MDKETYWNMFYTYEYIKGSFFCLRNIFPPSPETNHVHLYFLLGAFFLPFYLSFSLNFFLFLPFSLTFLPFPLFHIFFLFQMTLANIHPTLCREGRRIFWYPHRYTCVHAPLLYKIKLDCNAKALFKSPSQFIMANARVTEKSVAFQSPGICGGEHPEHWKQVLFRDLLRGQLQL